MPAAIIDNPELGITESVTPGRVITDDRTTSRGYPLVSPTNNGMIDDGHRINHAISMIDADMNAVTLSAILGIPAFLLLKPRH